MVFTPYSNGQCKGVKIFARASNAHVSTDGSMERLRRYPAACSLRSGPQLRVRSMNERGEQATTSTAVAVATTTTTTAGCERGENTAGHRETATTWDSVEAIRGGRHTTTRTLSTTRYSLRPVAH